MKKYIVKANATIESKIETDKPEDIVISLQKLLLDAGVHSYNLSDVCIDEVTGDETKFLNAAELPSGRPSNKMYFTRIDDIVKKMRRRV